MRRPRIAGPSVAPEGRNFNRKFRIIGWRPAEGHTECDWRVERDDIRATFSQKACPNDLLNPVLGVSPARVRLVCHSQPGSEYHQLVMLPAAYPPSLSLYLLLFDKR